MKPKIEDIEKERFELLCALIASPQSATNVALLLCKNKYTGKHAPFVVYMDETEDTYEMYPFAQLVQNLDEVFDEWEPVMGGPLEDEEITH